MVATSGGESRWRVFRNIENGTHMVLCHTENVPGYSVVFSSQNFAECIAYANTYGPAFQPRSYWVCRQLETGILLVRRSDRDPQMKAVYGPGTFQECITWARNHAGGPPQGIKTNVPGKKKRRTKNTSAARHNTA